MADQLNLWEIMNFLSTVYLGDRICTGLLLDGKNREVKIGVNLISRPRGHHWNYESSEDVTDGSLVIEGVSSISISPPGFLPNDWIELVSVDELAGNKFKIVFSIGATIPDSFEIQEVAVEIVGNAACIEAGDMSRIYT